MYIERITLVVNDQDKAIDFFTRVLGFELVEDTPSLTNDGRAKRWVAVRPPNAATSLLLAKADGPIQENAVGNQTGGRVGFFLRADDFDGTVERLKAWGAEIVSQPRTESYGRVMVFKDMAGNKWDLLE